MGSTSVITEPAVNPPDVGNVTVTVELVVLTPKFAPSVAVVFDVMIVNVGSGCLYLCRC